MYDLIVRNGRIIDGTGSAWFRADLGIRDGCIVRIGTVLGESAREIDAEGLFVAPGFIDIHTHSDESVLCEPQSASKITQGITTEVLGNCGYSAAPAVGMARAHISTSLAEFDLSLGWSSFASYLDQIRRTRPSVNIFPLVGHGTLRRAVQGVNEGPIDLFELERLLRGALNQGARGLSTGLIYPPGCFARTEEISQLCQIVAQYGGIYTSHIRNEGDGLLDAVTEAITIGEQTGVRVQISHLKAAGPRNHGQTEQALDLIERARERGVDVAYDAYPYTASSTGLAAYLPEWAHLGGESSLGGMLSDPRLSEKLRTETEGIVAARGGWEATVVSSVTNPAYQYMVGLSLATAAQNAGSDPWQVTKDLLLDNQGVEVICFSMSQTDVDRVVCHPLATYGSDATSRSPQGVLARGMPHPRAYGTFPRIIREYVRERRLMRLEEAVRKMTAAPSIRLGLHHRGLIRPGFAADLVGFDLEQVSDNATYLEPHQFASGIQFVVVNGRMAYNGEQMIVSPGFGKVLSFESI